LLRLAVRPAQGVFVGLECSRSSRLHRPGVIAPVEPLVRRFPTAPVAVALRASSA